MKRLSVLLVMIVGAMSALAAPASAHSELVSSNPAAGASLEGAPIGIELVFNQEINDAFATITLVGPDAEQWTQGTTSVDGTDVRVSVKDGAPAGDYTVGYRVISADGHPISGSLYFSVTADSVPTASPSTATPPPTYDPADPVASEGEPEPKENTTLVLSVIVVAVVALAAIAVALVARSKRRS